MASRLESYDKSIESGVCRILIDEATYKHIQDQFSTKAIGSVLLKGREQPTDINLIRSQPVVSVTEFMYE